MADSNRGNKERAVKATADTIVAASGDDTVSVGADIVVAPSKIHPKVQETVDKAMKGATIKVKSKKNYDAVKASLKKYNPNNLKVVHKPGLGHHSIAAR